MGWRHWLVLVALTGACDKPGPTAPPPGAVAATPVPAEEAPPAEAPEPEEDPEAEPESESESEEEEPKEYGPEDGWEAADSTAGELYSGASYYLTPALPAEWPPTGTTVVMYLVYPLEPIKGGGVEEYTCRQPAMRITFDVDGPGVEHYELKGTKKIGKLKQERRSPSDPIHGAEAALFDVVFKGKDPDKVKYVLHRYSDWLDKHPTIAKDLRKRLPAFVRFVERAN